MHEFHPLSVEDQEIGQHAWFDHYHGQVPRDWDRVDHIVASIDEYAQAGERMDEMQAEAVLTHPLPRPLLRLASSQVLTSGQLALIMVRSDLPHNVLDSVSVSQRLLGADRNVWTHARRIVKVEGGQILDRIHDAVSTAV